MTSTFFLLGTKQLLRFTAVLSHLFLVFAQVDDAVKGTYVYPAYYGTNKERLGSELNNFNTPYYLTLPQADHDRLYFEHTSTMWPDNIVYYDVDPHVPFEIQVIIQEAVDYMNSVQNCVQWRQRWPWGNESIVNFTSFISQDDESQHICNSGLGMEGDNQYINIGINCLKTIHGTFKLNKGLVLHEMMHTIGFEHEHQRTDRDCYVFVGNNLTCNPRDSDRWIVYDIFDPRYYPSGFPYDFDSITGYPQFNDYYFRNFHSHSDPGRLFFKRDGTMSEMDVVKIKFRHCGGKSWCQKPENHQSCVKLASDEKFDSLCVRHGQDFDKDPYTC